MPRLLSLPLLLCAVSAFAAPPPEPALAQAKAALAHLPLRFEANQGQWKPSVRYAARATGYTLLLDKHGPSLAFAGGRRIGVELLKSNPAPQMEPLDRATTRTDYFVGKREDWHTGVANYSRVRYRAVYPGIDVVYYGSRNDLEYDFVLQPGADPRSIRLKFSGADRVRITPEGDLSVEIGGERIAQKRPVVYQQGQGSSERREVAGSYTLLGRNEVGFRLARYDRSQPLVIDPAIQYLTYLGGTGYDQITAAQILPDGRLFMTGSTDTNCTSGLAACAIPFIDGAYDNYTSGGSDIFLTILDTTQANLPPVYFTYLGGGGNDIPLAMQVTSAGVVYLTGSTTSGGFPMVGASVQGTQAGGTDAFVVKLNPSIYGGTSLLYSTYIGGTSGNDVGNGIAVDSQGGIYVIGTTTSADFPVTDNAYANVMYGKQDAFICKIDPLSDVYMYSSFLGGELSDDGRSIAVDQNGLVYFAISTSSKTFPLEGSPYMTVTQGGSDIALGIMDLYQKGEASLVWSTFFGGSGNDTVRKMRLLSNGTIMMTGSTTSSDFPVTADAVQQFYGGGGDAYVSIVDPLHPAKFLVYSTYLGGSGGDAGTDLVLDASGSIYVTGSTISTDFPTTAGAIQTQWGGGVDMFISKIQPGVAGLSGLQSSTYIGPTGIFTAKGLVVGDNGTIYLVGTGGIGLPSSANATQGGYTGGSADGFVIAISQ